MQELTYEIIKNKGINISNIVICKKIRTLAKLGHIKLNNINNISELNKHLFDYIDYCGLDKLTSIKDYLYKLQPYMIERRKEQEKDKNFICIIDNLYRVSVYIKVDKTQFEELIISFHDDNKHGIAKTNSLINYKYVPIFADTILSMDTTSNKYVVKALFQRGLKILPLELIGIKCEDIFIVDKNSINLHFIEYCNQYIRDLYTSDLNIDFDQVEVFSMLQQISFTSYGNDTFSSISLLIDSLCVQSDVNSKRVADFALVTFVQNLNLTTHQQDKLLDLLNEKFKVTSIKGTDIILRRIKDNLSLQYKINQHNQNTTIISQDLLANYVNNLIN